ncbi:MAG: hypothetical protein PHI98_11165 [Eubacteriales bacterium]|nr:hypothetical protein [Eubacteriales bacterium]
MRRAEKIIPPNPPIREVENLSSVTECTGLTPSAILSDSEAENYAELYAIHEQRTNTLATGEQKE